ncbi:hypothetical protein [Phenylobacterium sp.]|uniref:hypothetical protein n=1 Tax=Phenylobacterium sp. TaxID=1871053 RepID=UPI0025D22C6C|nr:hypothetical protein [Phenylobacterium sp.]
MKRWALAVGLAVLASASPSGAADLSKSLVPGVTGVLGEYVQIAGGMAPGTPAALNTATFLRFRAAADAEAPRPANAVIVALPGFSSTPSQWLLVAGQLVEKAQTRTCEGKPCRIEVWVLQRRGANLADTTALLAARKARDPRVALAYYFGTPSMAPMPGKGAPARIVAPGPDAKWTPLTQGDLAFMADWGFETYAGDVAAMIGQIRTRTGGRNIFLAGHSQGGGFVSNYAGWKRPDGRRGVEGLSGLIFLDGGPSVGAEAPPSEAQLKAYLDRVASLRSGKAKVYTDGNGLLGAIAGPVSVMGQSVTGLYYAFSDPKAEAIFPMRAAGMAPAPGDDFLGALRVTWLARAGVTFDTEPVPGGGVQLSFLRFLGQGLGRLDFAPLPGTEALCDKTPEPMLMGPVRPGPAPTCTPTAAMVDRDKIYGWIEPGDGGPREAGTAKHWVDAQAWAPSRTNLRPVAVDFRDSGRKTIDAASMVPFNWYQSERWDFDAGFVGRYRTLKIKQDGVDLDVDKAAIVGVPVYVARQVAPPGQAGNPFPGVTDYTEINRTGTQQSDAARAITPLDPKINSTIYNHSDFIAADDSKAGQVRPGEPGAALVSDTLVDWVLKRSRGVATTPTPAAMGVRAIF